MKLSIAFLAFALKSSTTVTAHWYTLMAFTEENCQGSLVEHQKVDGPLLCGKGDTVPQSILFTGVGLDWKMTTWSGINCQGVRNVVSRILLCTYRRRHADCDGKQTSIVFRDNVCHNVPFGSVSLEFAPLNSTSGK